MEINFNLLLSIKWDLHRDSGPLLFIAPCHSKKLYGAFKSLFIIGHLARARYI